MSLYDGGIYKADFFLTYRGLCHFGMPSAHRTNIHCHGGRILEWD